MSKHNITLIDTTIDRVDTSLILTRANDKKPKLYRVTMEKVCYFASSRDIDAAVFEQIVQLQPGTKVRACTYEVRGRRQLAWIRSTSQDIAPYDAYAQKEGHFKLLRGASIVLMISLAALMIPNALIVALAVFVTIISLMGCLLAVAGLIESLITPRIRTQERWWQEPRSAGMQWDRQ